MNLLYQKHHGLPGIALIKGTDGTDGNNGCNIYFGYVSDFFSHIDISVENFIRTALKSASSGYYTGLYKIADSSVVSTDIVSNYSTSKRTIESGEPSYTTDVSTYTVRDSSNIFQNIYDEPATDTLNYMNYYNYSYKKYSYDNDSELSSSSQTYVKVDSSTFNISGFNSDTTNSNKWDAENGSWPYVLFYGTEDKGDAVDFKTGKSSISKIDGFELFTTSSSDKYVYTSDNDRYNDFRYIAYNSNNSSLLNGSTTSYLDDNSGIMKTTYLEYLAYQYSHINPPYSNSVNYVKYAHNAIETVSVTSTLNNDIKTGDVIYFYTDPETFALDHTIEYMVVITKALENCTLDDLIASASIVNPLTFKYVDTNTVKGNEYLSTLNRVCSVYYKDTDSNHNLSLRGKNFCNMLTYGSNSAFNVGNMSSDNNNDNTTLLLYADDNDLTFKTKVETTSNQTIIKNIITSSSSSKLKISNAYAKKYNIGNIETEKCFSSNDIILDSAYHCHTISEGDYDYANNLITINSDDITNSDNFDDYECGVIDIVYNYSLYDENSSFIDGENCTINKYTFTSHTDMNFPLTKTYDNNTAHIVLVWISLSDGMKYFSNHSLIKYDYSIRNYTFEVIEDETTDTTDLSSEDDVLVYTPKGITADKVNDGILTIELPNTSTDIQLFVNSTEISLNNTYSNSWCSLTYRTIENSIEEGIHTGTNPTVITLDVVMSDNIPQLTTYDDIDTARKYIASPGQTNDLTSGCDIFNMLLSDSAVSTKDRSVTITVKYNYQKYGLKHNAKSYYKLTQPGYVEKRKVPKVDISIDSDLNSIEKANNIDNGILSNQFQFFLNVNITDFDRETWSSYVDENKISLTVEIKNVPVDYDSVEKYAIQSAESMYTYHAYPVDTNNDYENNYLRMSVYPISNDISDPYNSTLKELDSSLSYAPSTNKETKYTYNNITVDLVFSTSKNISKTAFSNYNIITLNGSLFNNDKPEEATRGTGINDSVTIKIDNIKFSDIDNGPMRFRVFVELANPIFSRLFFRYYVSNMYITYTDEDPDNPEEEKTTTFFVGTNNLASVTQTGRMQSYDYMFASDTFNAFICPLSLTAVLNDDILKAVYSSGKTTGSDEQIQLSLSTYLPDIPSQTDTEKIESLVNKQFIDWFNFGLKKKYLQDNIKSFYVQPIHISDYYDKISDNDIFIKMNTDRDTAYNSAKSEVVSDAYLSVAYNAYSYYQKTIYDEPQFYYNNTLYKSSKYNQLHNNSPVFLSLSIAYDVRDSLLINSMDVWNYEYKQTNNVNTGLFTGHINSYGNGYEFLDSTYDTSESTNSQLSITDTKAQNEYSFFDAPYTQTISLFSKSSDNYPNLNKWFRTLLWQIKWQYPKYYTDTTSQIQKVDAYDIIDSGNYFTYYDGTTNKYKIPHNLTYSLYPRCAYNSDNQINIIFMLRCPTVCQENQNKMNYSDVKFTIDENSYNANQLSNSNLTSLL